MLCAVTFTLGSKARDWCVSLLSLALDCRTLPISASWRWKDEHSAVLFLNLFKAPQGNLSVLQAARQVPTTCATPSFRSSLAPGMWQDNQRCMWVGDRPVTCTSLLAFALPRMAGFTTQLAQPGACGHHQCGDSYRCWGSTGSGSPALPG